MSLPAARMTVITSAAARKQANMMTMIISPFSSLVRRFQHDCRLLPLPHQQQSQQQ